MLNRRNLLKAAAAAPLTTGLGRGLAVAAEARKQIKITGLETDLLRIPAAPYADAIHDFGGDGGGVVLRLKTDAGITGWGYSNFGMISGGPRVVQAILEHEIKPVLIGQDPAFPRRIRADLWRALEYQGVQGVTQFAMSVVDIAVWDILGKAAGLPVYKMLGAVRDRMPAYAMCGWYRENDKDHSQYKRNINETLEAGYRAFKVKVGKFDLDDDVERIQVGFKSAGKGIRIMSTRIRPTTAPKRYDAGASISNWAFSGTKNRSCPTITKATPKSRPRSTCVWPAARTSTTSIRSWTSSSKRASMSCSLTIDAQEAPPSGWR